MLGDLLLLLGSLLRGKGRGVFLGEGVGGSVVAIHLHGLHRRRGPVWHLASVLDCHRVLLLGLLCSF